MVLMTAKAIIAKSGPRIWVPDTGYYVGSSYS